MRSLSDTIARLAALRAQGMSAPSVAPSGGRLVELTEFGTNPGALGAWFYVPETADGPAPLVVVLHGCTQNAADYDQGSGWSQLADELGFALLFPEQRRANNMNLCFNWFEPGDSRRDAGEPLSIKQMIEAMVDRHDIDRGRIFVNGLSAGGAMTSVLLATYPELFAGGAIIAGLPYGSATNIPQALERMRGHGGPDDAALAEAIRAASPHRGPWPSISVWHGTGDHVVNASNGDAILKQWQAIHDLGAEPDRIDEVDGHPHRLWCDAEGRAVMEDYRIAGMGHGTPLATLGEQAYGASGAHMLEVAISSTLHIARFWKLTDARQSHAAPLSARPQPRPPAQRPPANDRKPAAPAVVAGVGKVIEDALRAAGLVR